MSGNYFNKSQIIPENNTLNLVELEESRLYKRRGNNLIKSVIIGNTNTLSTNSKSPRTQINDETDSNDDHTGSEAYSDNDYGYEWWDDWLFWKDQNYS